MSLHITALLRTAALGALASVLLAVGASSQEPGGAGPTPAAPQKQVLRQDPAAVAALRATLDRVYRPRDHGLATASFQFELKAVGVDGQSRSIGPYLVKWANEGDVLQLLDADGKLLEGVPQAVASVLGSILGDAVGYVTAEQIFASSHISLEGERSVRAQIPEWIGGAPFHHMIFAMDERGLATSQRVYSANGSLVYDRRFDFTPHGEEWIVSSRQDTDLNNRQQETTLVRKEIGGFLLPESITAKVDGFVQVVTYSDWKLNTPDSAPTPAPPKAAPTTHPTEGAAPKKDG